MNQKTKQSLEPGDTEGKFCWKATSGGIIEEKSYATNAFMGKILPLFFYVQNAII